MSFSRSGVNQINISRQAVLHNFDQFRQLVGPEVKIMAVVKANAYGHGMVEISRILRRRSVDWFGVNSLAEALKLRKLSVNQPILVMGFVSPGDLRKALEQDISLIVYRKDIAKKANHLAKKIKKKARIHLKIETGTNRQGITPENLAGFVRFIRRHEHLLVEGVCSHLANVEDTLDETFPKLQMERFENALKMIERQGVEVSLRHLAATAATILHPESRFDMVRIGIGLYGLWPSAETRISAKERGIELTLKPALSFESRLIQIKEVKAGETIGYGRTFLATKSMRLGIVPVGYWDGYDRRLSGNGQVLVNHQLVPVTGRVCMNMLMIDLSTVKNVKEGGWVTLIGAQGQKQIGVDDLAELMKTINYEVVTRLNPILTRRVL